MSKAESIRTYQARVRLTPEQSATLDGYAALCGRVERTLFARLAAGDSLTALKRDLIRRFGITARQFNAISATVRGKIQSVQEARTRLIGSARLRIERAEGVLRKVTDPAKRHHKRRRIATLKARLANLEAEAREGGVGICFGSRKLFREQFSLAASGLASHAEWLSAWRDARSSQFFAIGSKDETAGCQSCVASLDEDGSLTLRLRLPDALGTGKHLAIRGIHFAYGHEAIEAAIGRNLSSDKADWQAVSYRFVRDRRGWRVYVSVSVPEGSRESERRAGVIGIDINAGHLAVTETDRFGNPVGSWTIPCATYGLTSERRKAVIGDAVKQAVAIAVERKKPIGIEKLNFATKKSALEAEPSRHARRLSSFAYSFIQAVIRARAYDAGIEVLDTNPAYSSVIGKHKFQARYGLSAHTSAACVIARRVVGLGERLPSQLRVTPPLLAKNRGRHVWSLWAVVAHRDRAALAARRRPGREARSPAASTDIRASSIARLAIPPPSAGAIPARESSSTLFGGRCG